MAGVVPGHALLLQQIPLLRFHPVAVERCSSSTLSPHVTRFHLVAIVAYVSEATPIPLATTHIILHHTIQDDGSPHTFNSYFDDLLFSPRQSGSLHTPRGSQNLSVVEDNRGVGQLGSCS